MRAYGKDWDLPLCPVHGCMMIPYIRSDDILEVRCPRECNEEADIPDGMLEYIQSLGIGYEKVRGPDE